MLYLITIARFVSRLATALLLLCGLGAAPALSAEPEAKVAAEEPAFIAEADKPITLSVSPKLGATEIVMPDGAVKQYRLRYTADPTVMAKTDSLVYLVEGDPEPHPVAISIAPTVSGFSGATYEESFKAIFVLFVLAVLLESALAVVFNWRPFVEIFVPRAVRPLIAFAVALIFVRLFELDVVTSLVNAVKPSTNEPGLAGEILTALTIAGGSSGINTMLVALGFREVRTPTTEAPKVPPTKAWVALRALPGSTSGRLWIFAGAPPGTTQEGDATRISVPLIGIIEGRSTSSPLSWFMSDRGRLPTYGGHTVEPDQDYLIVVAKESSDNKMEVLRQLGPFKLDKGAMIDIDVQV